MFLLLSLLACTTSKETDSTQLDSSSPALPSCSEIMENSSPAHTMDEIATILVETRKLVPELETAMIELKPIDSESTFLAANVDLSTAGNEPFERNYIIQINPLLLENPPSGGATVAILVHELKHILDYTEMSSLEFAEFGLWYAQGDVAEYERETDLFSMERGCAEGLIEFRLWLYEQISPETLEEKKENYYTPEEIQEWIEQN